MSFLPGLVAFIATYATTFREIHGSDLIRAHEGNPDAHDDDPTKIHWAKFNMLGKFITITSQCQIQCRTSNDYDFPERLNISNLIWQRNVMNDQAGFLETSISCILVLTPAIL